MSVDRLLDLIAWTFLFTTITALKYFEALFENTVNGKSFVMYGAIYGVVCSVGFLFLLYKTNRKYFRGGEKRASAILSYFFGIVVLTLLAAAVYNIKTARKDLRLVQAVVVNKSKNVSYGTTYLTLQLKDRKERFNPTKEEWNRINERDTLYLEVGKGSLGYDYIFNFLAGD